jgi:hypothetical protein
MTVDLLTKGLIITILSCTCSLALYWAGVSWWTVPLAGGIVGLVYAILGAIWVMKVGTHDDQT